jgi:hypothetical protein
MIVFLLTDWGHVAQYLGTVNADPVKRIVGKNIAGKSVSSLTATKLHQHTCCSCSEIFQMTSHSVNMVKTYQESFCVKK